MQPFLNPVLVGEEPALPYFDNREPMWRLDEESLRLDDIFRSKLSELFPGSRFDPGGKKKVSALVEPPAERCASIDFLLDNQNAEQQASILEIREMSRLSAQKKNATKNAYLHLNTPPLRYNPQTGLPSIAYGEVSEFDPYDNESSDTAARGFLEINKGLLGVETGIESLRPPKQTAEVVQGGLTHVPYCQWHLVDATWLPVYGARVTAHLTVDKEKKAGKAFVTSSLMPIPKGISVIRSVKLADAVTTARTAVAAALTSPTVTAPIAVALKPWLDGNPQLPTEVKKLVDMLELASKQRNEALEYGSNYFRGLLQSPFIDGGVINLNEGEINILSNRMWNLTCVRPTAGAVELNEKVYKTVGDVMAPTLDFSSAESIFADMPAALDLFKVEIPTLDDSQIKAIAELRHKQEDAVDSLQAFIADIGNKPDLVGTRRLDDLIAGLLEVSADSLGEEWISRVVYYERHPGEREEKDEVFILPFAGSYHLAYLVETVTVRGDNGWRVFVAATNEKVVLGRPERMVLFAGGFYFFESAKKLADGDPSSFPNGEWKQIRADSDFASLFTLKFHDDSSGSQIQLQELVNNDTSDQGTPPSQAMSQIPLHVFDAMNVIYHAWKTYHYIAKDCRQSDLLPGTSQAQRIILSIGATQTTDFETGMLPIASGFNTIITFQTDRKGEGFAGNGGRIFTPARDPEVVAHEICHALLWLMDRAPYESRFDGVPFGRALLEGYCTYLARSIYGAIDDESERWASAAYREWGDRWNLGFLGQANADRAGLAALAAPNNYPELETIGLPVYDVGMVWARALWDVRKLLTGMKDKGKISADGAKLADWLALQSYRCVHGWSTGFEAAAEGLIAAAHVIDPMATDVPTSSVNTSSDATIALPDATSEIVKAITEIFAKRGILAQRGVQAIAKVGAQWFAGTDFGLQSADNPIGPWNEVRLDSEAPPGVVGLAAFEGGGNHGALIATERGVYRWQNGAATPIASQDPSVPSVPDPMCSEGILCIAVVDGFAYVGTRRNIWRASVAEGSFRRWTNDSLMAVEGFVHSSNIGGFGPILFFHTPMLIGWTQLTSEPPEWQELLVKDESGEIISLKLISGIQLIDDEHLCVLTVHNGVKRLQLTKTPDGVLIGQIIATSSSGDFTSAKPRCICQNSGHFLVGTTDGIYGTPVGNFGDWTKYARGGDAIITAIAADDTKVVAGTHEDLVKVGSPDVTSTEQWSSLPIHAL